MDLANFSEVFVLLATQLRLTDYDTATVRAYHETLKDLDFELVAMAAQRLARTVNGDGQAWFPKTGEWRVLAGKIEQERVEQQRAILRDRRRAGLPPQCGRCEDTGWDVEGGRAAKCRCLSLRRLEVLGVRPMPELPAAVPDHQPSIARADAMVQSVVRGMP